jgi:YVTN family beta-propeller protein
MYVVNSGFGGYRVPEKDSNSVSVIDTNTNTQVELPLLVGANPHQIAFAPPQH